MSLRLGVLRGQTGTYLVSGNGARWVSLQGVIGGANLVGQPGLHGAITRDQRPQSGTRLLRFHFSTGSQESLCYLQPGTFFSSLAYHEASCVSVIHNQQDSKVVITS